MTGPSVTTWRFSRRTGWTQNLQTPLRRFLRTETGGAVVLLGATLAALVWANADPAGYAATWHTVLVIRSGRWQLADSWQGSPVASGRAGQRVTARCLKRLRRLVPSLTGMPAAPSGSSASDARQLPVPRPAW